MAYGYLLDPWLVYKQAIKDGTAEKYGRTFATYVDRLAAHCGIKSKEIVNVRDPDPEMPPVFCLVAATNVSKQSKVPRTDIIEKAKIFLGTTDEPKWYYIVRV